MNAFQYPRLWLAGALLTLCLLVGLPAKSMAVAPLPGFTVGGYTLVSSVRVGRTTYDLTYRAAVTNGTGLDAAGVSGSVTSLVSSAVVLDGEVSFGAVPDGVTLVSTDTFTLRTNRLYGLKESDLSWAVTGTLSDPVAGMDFVYVAPGTFQMGDTFGDGYSWERPVHTVTLTKGYYLGMTEVTQAQWQAVMGSNPSYFQPSRGYPPCPTCPVEQVSWNDIQTYIQKLNDLTGKTYRLPTEAEWEFAAKGGTLGQGYKYPGSNNADEVAWHWNNWGSAAWYSGQTATHTVAANLPNELGLYDMGGNVWEWVQDWFDWYPTGPVVDPQGPASPSPYWGSDRVIRGGSWYDYPIYVRSSSRGYWPDYGRNSLGFRLVLPQ